MAASSLSAGLAGILLCTVAVESASCSLRAVVVAVWCSLMGCSPSVLSVLISKTSSRLKDRLTIVNCDVEETEGLPHALELHRRALALPSARVKARSKLRSLLSSNGCKALSTILLAYYSFRLSIW